MKSYDVVGWLIDGDYYCPTCAPDNTESDRVRAIFADSETDSFSHCVVCEELIEEGLTAEGILYTIDQMRSWLVRRSGRLEILTQWAHAMSGYGLEPPEREIIDMILEAERAPQPGEQPKCEHDYHLDRRCGVLVCLLCDDHKGLARCFCGWSRDGGDGRQQLLDFGERIEEEDP